MTDTGRLRPNTTSNVLIAEREYKKRCQRKRSELAASGASTDERDRTAGTAELARRVAWGRSGGNRRAGRE